MRGRNRIPFDRHPLAMLLGAIVVVVGVLAAIVVFGLEGVFHFLFSFLLPIAGILLVVVGTIGLAVQGGCEGLGQQGPAVLYERQESPSRRGPLQSGVLAAYEPLLGRKRGDGLLLLVGHPRPVDTR
jgi:hypothetical protein